ncbi:MULTISPECIES: sensor histidine kinase [unclassified Oceanispirochaeta]|uniref:cache domain-containing sensor histidine kinase n=1 Tax=unclassified Oceanispirochaeta TaxID=2635722 RepID=UPI0011C02B14|nr:sensor histidine kinase [Oceanispirochaeta sp. M1]MBF9015375.1 sensor histidine kinase [Oceanispirochaeta sp. M2]NPD71834.1 sensor histidine kinase [Oceanispirochaeta sp. M1]
MGLKNWVQKSLRNRLFLTISLVSTILLFTQGTSLLLTSSNSIENLVLSEAATTLNLVRQNLNSQFEQMSYVIKDLETDEEFIEKLKDIDTNGHDLTNTLLRYISRRVGLMSITMLPIEKGILSTTYTYDIKEKEIRESHWYRQVIETGTPLLIYMDVRDFSSLTLPDQTEDDTKGKREQRTQYITLVHPLSDRSGKFQAMILVSLDYFTIFENIILHIPSDENRQLYLYNKNGDILFPFIHKGPSLNKDELLSFQNEGHVARSIGKKEYWYVYSASKDGILLLEEILKSELMAPVNRHRQFFIFSLIISLLITLFVSSLLSSRITRPIKRLEKEMHRFEDKQFSLSVPEEQSDEVGALERSFNHMMTRMQDYQQRLLRNQEEKRSAELKALQAQIKPHFLYNTLDSIKWMALIKGNDGIVEMVSALTSLLKNNINQHEEMIPLSQEMDNIQKFMTIQNFRFPEKYDLTISIEQDCASLPVPKLIIQPLVENALLYAFTDEKGCVDICCRKQDKGFICMVADNGRGFDKDILRAWEEGSTIPSKGNGVSLQNIRNRLRLHYGESSVLKLENTESGGLCTIIIEGERL